MKRLSRDRLRLHEVENAIAELPVERLYFFGADERQVAIYEGSDSYVFFRLSTEERRRMRDGHMIHNHPPRTRFPRDDPRHDALSFSVDDWRVAADLDVADSIVVTPSWRYILRRPITGWLAVDPHPDDIAHMFTTLGGRITKSDAENVRLGLTTTEAAEATRSHRVNERYAEEIGAIYRRERR